MHATRIAAIALLAALGAPAAAGAATDRVPVQGAVAWVANRGPCDTPNACGRSYVALGGGLLSTQPAWVELQHDGDALDPSRVRGELGFTGCLAGRCGTLRLAVHGRWSRGSSAPFSGTAVIRGAGGGLRGVRGAIEVRPGSPVHYRGTLLLPPPPR
jgi:hypothetical protein